MAGTAAQIRTEGAVLRVAYTPAATTTIDWSVQFGTKMPKMTRG